MRKYLNERQRKAALTEQRRAKLAGEGLFLYQNMTKATLVLGKPCKDGRTHIEPMQRFEGDSYFKNVKECVCLATLQDPTPPPAPAALTEATTMPENKLITEVPPTVTKDGKVEFVEEKPGQEQFNESQPDAQAPKGRKKKDVLLSEAPVDSIRIMR